LVDKRIIDKAVKGDKKAERQLYEVLSKPLFLLCLRYLKNQEDAEVVLTLFFAFNGLLSHIPEGEKPFEIAQDYFLGVGQESDLIGNNVAVMLGFRIFGHNGILEDNNVMFKVDFSVTPKLKIFWSLYQSTNFSQDIPSANFLGINYVIF
jgi:hypothetical protein